MRIACPACSTGYEVPDARLLPGRVVRCARCGTDWVPLAAPAETARAPEPPVPEPPAFDPPALEPPALEPPADAPPRLAPPPPPPRRTNRGLLAGWLLSFAALGVLGWAAYTYRAEVMRAWPASERGYAVLGLVRP